MTDLLKRFPDIIGSGKTVVDLGCGSGELLNNLGDRFEERIGLDVSARRLEDLADGKISGWHFQVADLNKRFPLANGSADVVIANQVIEHIIDPRQFVLEIHRVLKPNGRYLIATPNIRYLKNIAHILLSGYGPRTGGGNLRDGLWDNGHLHYFTHKDMRELIFSAGFQDIQSRALIDLRVGGWLRHLMDQNSMLPLLREFLSGNILTWGSK